MLDAIKEIINKDGDISLQDIADIVKVILKEIFAFIKKDQNW